MADMYAGLYLQRYIWCSTPYDVKASGGDFGPHSIQDAEFMFTFSHFAFVNAFSCGSHLMAISALRFSCTLMSRFAMLDVWHPPQTLVPELCSNGASPQ